MFANYKIYKIMYKCKIHVSNLKSETIYTDWKLLELDNKIYCGTIIAPTAHKALHWAGKEISESIKKIESDICEISDLMINEISHTEACSIHVSICERCELPLS